MITVLKHGKRTALRGTCAHCGCEIECSENDVLFDRDSSAMKKYVFCPECGERIYITSDAVYNMGCATFLNQG